LSSLRIELASSRGLQVGVVLLAVLAAAALWMSALPRAALLSVPLLTAFSLWRLGRAPRGHLLLESGGLAEWWPPQAREPLPVETLELERRGPLAVLGWRCGGRVKRWPAASDTLRPATARALQLWIARHRPATPDHQDIPQGPA